MPVMTPWGEGYRWTDILSDISKIERQYKITRPKGWSGNWTDLFKDYGFVPVDPAGYWWNRPTTTPELPIVYAPVANTSYTIPTGIGGGTTPLLPAPTTTGLIDTVNCIGDATFTELPTGETVAKVTTGGVVTSVSSAVGTAAVGAAVGFGVGVGWFEAKPEFWTKVSNTVFGTDLDPAEIGQMARDTNALVVIKDGIVYMAEDMINAIRDAFFDNGAADATITIPPVSGATAEINVTTLGGKVINSADVKEYFLNIGIQKGKQVTFNQKAQATLDFIDSINADYSAMGGPAEPETYNNGRLNCQFYQNVNITLPTTVKAKEQYANTGIYLFKGEYSVGHKYNVNFVVDRETSTEIIVRGDWEERDNTIERLGYGQGSYSTERYTYTELYSTNAEIQGMVDGVTPTGEQGTKDQPLAVLFPDWVGRGIETIAGDGLTKVTWLPVSLPSNKPLVDGIPFNTTEAQQGTLPDNYTETASKLGEQAQEQTKNAPSYPTPPIPPVPDVTPTPDDPAIAGGGGSATGLANLYNPTLAQVKQFSRWLWGSDGLNLDQLKKLLQDPMQAIIGLHVMYATPTTGANRDIQVGYINSGVPSKIVTEQYTEIDCGTVTINEYFGDARDYSPYTQVYCYLPFIGIVELNADDVVNSTLGIKYKIDVLTGCCLAQLTVKKFGLDAVLYTYTGNCAVQMPITSGNYLSTVSSLLGAVVSGAAAVATGGALAPVAIGAAANAMGGGARASVAMSGSLGSNAGAMGIRKPYLIIKRVESADANGYNEFYGYPTNKRVNLSQLTGYVRVKEINLSGTNATEDEQNEIVALLKEGVIL